MIPFAVFILGFVCSTLAWAAGEGPVTQGLAGAGRAGVPREAVFSNPAAAAFLQGSSSFAFFQKPSILEMDAGGRVVGIGASDGETSGLKGSFAYLRTSRARLRGSAQGYEDRKEYRFASGMAVTEGVMGGLAVRYVTKRVGGAPTSFFQGDLGTIFPIYAGLVAGVTLENALDKEAEAPRILGAGLRYDWSDFSFFADGYKQMIGPAKGENGWAVAAEIKAFGDFTARAGRFQDGVRRMKGWSAGLSWAGPRASFDYAMRTAGTGPKEQDHTLGMNIGF